MVLSAIRDRGVTQSRNLDWRVRQLNTPPFQQTRPNYKLWKDSVLREKYGHALGSPDGLPPLTTVVCINVNGEVTTYICL